MHRVSSITVAVVFGGLTFGAWAYFNAPSSEPPWPDRLRGVGFAPFQSGDDPTQNEMPSLEEVEADVALLSTRVSSLRTYSSTGPLEAVPRLAEKHHLRTSIGAWLDKDTARNAAETEAVIRLANQHTNVVRVFVGNEVILRDDLTVDELGSYLDRVSAEVEAPVGTAEPWHVWLKHPELADHVDFIGIHLLPYWEGVEVEAAVDYVFECFDQVQAAFPDLPIVIAEVGWPSRGRTLKDAVASASNEATFLRRFLARAEAEGQIYYLMEAFDQPWKADGEGEVGAYWGIFDAEREAKFELVDPIIRVPEWQLLAGISIALSLLMLALFFANSGRLATRGRSVIAAVVFATATVAVWVVYDFTNRYLTISNTIVGSFLIAGMLGLFAVLFAEAHEWAEAHWVRGFGGRVPRATDDGWRPKVSIHVPAYNEPPDMLIETIDALARLDYPDFEVLVIDNNTKHEELWRPVEAHCRAIDPEGRRFRFFHVDGLAGFKAGALNYALERTSPDAEIVAVIDADYQVIPRWLDDLVPGFADPKVAIMQAPQDYRDGEDNAFKAACYAEYRGFFAIGMVTRNERNAIIQHGTMTMVRRTTLDAVGGWATDSITEDAELGLRIFEAGQEAHYVPVSYGRGLMPDTFLDFKKQRFRWAYGAMQILKSHARSLLGRERTALTAGQRYHFVAGWLPWLADGLNLVVTLVAIGWSIAMAADPYAVAPPLVLVSALPLSLFTFKLVKLVHLYMARIGANKRQTLAAAFVGLALSHTIALAVLKGAVTKDMPFFRTPKLRRPHGLVAALGAALPEIGMLVLIGGSVALLETIGPDLQCLELSIWKAMLLIQSLPCAAAVIVSCASAFPLPARLLGRESLALRPVRTDGAEAATSASVSAQRV